MAGTFHDTFAMLFGWWGSAKTLVQKRYYNMGNFYIAQSSTLAQYINQSTSNTQYIKQSDTDNYYMASKE
ncbi:hypothetical protein KAR91_24100 [Candidatus Pacearchaeota archaeon]|nr:hypothetical protein [Candidatus Pacearchaeota archaeon]